MTSSITKQIKHVYARLPSNGMNTEEIRWRVPPLLWLPLIVCAILLFIVDVFQYEYYIISPTRIPGDFSIIEQNSLKGFLIKTPGCRIPYLSAFDEKIKKFIKIEERHACNKGIPALFESNLTSISLIYSSLDNYTIQDVNALKCCYRPFYRREPSDSESDNKVKFDKDCIPIQETAEISHEFIKVECSLNNSLIYKDYFSFVPVKKVGKKNTDENFLNVLVIGLDSISRLNFHRQMHKTVNYLLHNTSAVELLGYNKVGDNTFPNLIPVLTGKSEVELKKICWKDDNQRFDKCPFVWNEYKKNGALTSFGEDASWMGLFNYQRRGFTKQPTDYMWGAFNRFVEGEIGNSHNMNANECDGAREIYKELINHIVNFVTVMDRERLRYFAFYWEASLSHDYLNKPRLGDLDYYNMIKSMKESGYLNNTAMIFMSDHGMRWGDIRQTFQGRMEERLPFIFIILPEWYTKQYPNAYNNLLKNSRRLTTPFDLHETLKDLINPFSLTAKYLQSRYNRTTKLRSFSLFNEIYPTRTCEDAGIESHWCTCQQSKEVSKNDTTVKEAAAFAVDHMNSMLEGYRQCANLTLQSILNSQIMTHGNHILNNEDVSDYMVTLQTFPGDGVFEVTVRTRVDKKKTYQFEVMGTISRLNLYGKQSACISDFHLKLYCYCNSFL